MSENFLEKLQERRSPTEKRTNRHNDDRDAYDRDRARIIHSSPFRRLQAKTQVLGINQGDFHRTRLTHTMEVAQIASGIVNRMIKDKVNLNGLDKSLIPDRQLIEAICFSHDLGHPPFGHGGERALNRKLIESYKKISIA